MPQVACLADKTTDKRCFIHDKAPEEIIKSDINWGFCIAVDGTVFLMGASLYHG